MATWTSWSGLSSADPVRETTPHDAGEVVDAVLAARRDGLRVKMTGSGHSFNDVAVTDGLLLHPGHLRGITAVDRTAMTVTVLAGTPLHELNAGLERLGLSLHNMGDVDGQTVAGAISTGTHGTGGQHSSLSAQVCGLELVTGDGTLLCATHDEHPEVLELARVGVGALGVLTSVTFEVEPVFTLAAHEGTMRWTEATARFEELTRAHHHFEMYWFPHTERVLTKANDRVLDDPEPLSRRRAWFEDQFLANRVYGWMQAWGNRAPALVPRLNALSAGALGERRYSDVAHRVFVSPRSVRFREMEYAVPREAGIAALTEARALIERRGWRVGFPVEVRSCPADDVPLSPGHDRETVWLAFHTNAATDHTDYFAGVEEILLAHGGRPHWGKLHTRAAADLAPAYDRWRDFAAMRDRLDPDRLFANPYLERVLGP